MRLYECGSPGGRRQDGALCQNRDDLDTGLGAPDLQSVTDQAIGSLLRRADSLPLMADPFGISSTLRGLERPPVTVALA